MKVKDFNGFMSSKALNEQENFDGTDAGMQYGANPEDEAAEGEFEEGEIEGEEMEGEEEEVTLDDLKAMVDDLTERIEALEPDREEEGEEGEEDMEGEEEEADEEGA